MAKVPVCGEAAKSTTIGSGAHAHLAAEEAAKEARLLIADLRTDRVDAQRRPLEQLLRFLQSQSLHIVERIVARRLVEPPGKAALGEAALRRHLCHGRMPRVIVCEPCLASAD